MVAPSTATHELVRGYLEAEGYAVSRRGDELLVGARRGLGEVDELIHVWVASTRGGAAELHRREADYLAKFQEAARAQPYAQRFMIVDSTAGLGVDFRQRANRFDVRIRTRIQFFDTSFMWEESPQAPSAAKELRDRGVKAGQSRIPQRYETLTIGGGKTKLPGGADLLEDLHTAQTRPSSDWPQVSVIVGPAGIGKSHLFEALFARLHSDFLHDKLEQRFPAVRPLPLLPQYLRAAGTPRVEALLGAYLQSDFARPLTEDVFAWLMTHGLAAWLLDGLDEVIATDPDFFDYLLKLMTMPGGTPPKMVICVRDSLFATNEGLREFCEDFPDDVGIFQLQPWNQPSKRAYARLYLGSGKGPAFILALSANPTANDLATNPYYCRLLADEFSAGSPIENMSAVQLLDQALSSIISRDYEKSFLEEAIISEQDVLEFFEAIAVEDLKRGLLGVSVEVPREMAELVLPADIEGDRLASMVGQMSRLGLFAPTETGNIQFAQEILEQHLIGRAAAKVVKDTDRLLQVLAIRPLHADWQSMRTLAVAVQDQGAHAALARSLPEASGRPTAFRNLVQLLALSAPSQDAGIQGSVLNHMDLAAVRFTSLDLAGYSFIGSDLTDVEFVDCDLKGADFTDAVIKNTWFKPTADGLAGAQFGNLERFHSLLTENGNPIWASDEAAKWVSVRTGSQPLRTDPCRASLQLRHLMLKFVRPDGSARRSRLDIRGAKAGKKYADPEAALIGAVRYGYLLADPGRDRVLRPEGDRYNEMVKFASRLEASPTMLELISDLCDQPACTHLPLVQ